VSRDFVTRLLGRRIRGRTVAALDAADAADALVDLGIAEVLDAAGAGEAHAQFLRGVDDDMTRAGDAHLGLLGDELRGAHVARAGQAHRELARLAGEARLQRAGSREPQRIDV